MLTIETKYIGPSNTRPARVAAYTTDKRPSTGKRDRITISYSFETQGIEAHREAAKALALREGFGGTWCMVGETERGYLFTRPQMIREDLTFTIEEKGA